RWSRGGAMPCRPERAEAGPAEAEVEELVAAREAARRGRDWAEADRLRDQLAALGVVVEDTPNGPRWKRR
ncbi:MAG TPA: cysteine--tRNA ligase, partial [Thermoanaerobaculia bacterium]|nr:cysteine--tRNA ligase [Thermoanaerobaculia bacterium]